MGKVLKKLFQSQSVFDDRIFDYAVHEDPDKKSESANGYAVMKISPAKSNLSDDDKRYFTIIGVINENVKIDIKAKWETMDNTLVGKGVEAITKGKLVSGALTGGKSSLAKAFLYKDVLQRTGVGIGGQYATKKFYNGGGGYLSISQKIKIVDWDGTGSPIKAAHLIAMYLVPQNIEFMSPENVEVIKNLINKAKDTIADVADTTAEKVKGTLTKIGAGGMLENIATSAGKATESVLTGLQNVMDIATSSEIVAQNEAKLKSAKNIMTSSANQAGTEMKEELIDAATLRKSPPTLILEISNWFKRDDMILESATFDFSKKVTATGPLSVDIDLVFSSRTEIFDVNELGFAANRGGENSGGGGRVFTVNGGV